MTHYRAGGPFDFDDFGVQDGQQTGLIKENGVVIEKSVALRISQWISPYRVRPESPFNTMVSNMFVNIVIGTTNYYQDPQNVWASGVSGTAALSVQVEMNHTMTCGLLFMFSRPNSRHSLYFYNDVFNSVAANQWDIIPTTTMIGVFMWTIPFMTGQML